MFEKNKDKESYILSTSTLDPFSPSKGSAKVVIGNGVKFKGEITEADDVQVDGQADVTMHTSNLVVGGTGNLKGNITSTNIDVWGNLEGEIKVEGTLTIQEQGSISGSVEYQEIQVKLGGKIKGEIKSLDKIKNISDIKTKTLQEAAKKSESN